MLKIAVPKSFISEKSYTLAVLLGERLGIEYDLTVEETLTEYKFSLPNGNMLVLEDHFWGKHTEPAGYLDAAHVPAAVERLSHPWAVESELPVLFGQPELIVSGAEIRCRADLLASAFFLLTRWEDYVRPERDAHGRFPAAAALAVRAGFLHRPVVDEYVALLAQMLTVLGYAVPGTRYPVSGYRVAWSCDVDHPRLWWRSADRLRTLAGSFFRRGNLRETAQWLAGPVFARHDPYDVFDEWMDLAEARGHRIQFNFLGDRAASSDCYYPLRHPFVVDLIAKIDRRGHGIGFHPSYEAYDDPTLFDRELASVQALTRQPVTGGRHHYLRFAAPVTWRRWAAAGLSWDSTLGYAEAAGFRCGTSHDFPVFDFIERRPLPLREKPLLAMDVTAALYQRKTPDEALAEWLALRKRVERHGGVFTVLWHNSSWNTPFWRPWQKVLLELLK